MKIFWIRHLPVEKTGRYIGVTDVPLSPLFAKEAEVEKSRSQEFGKLKDCIWFSSPLRRAVDSAKIFGADNFQIVPELAEQNFGIWENKTYEEVGDWGDVPAHLVKPAGGESFVELCARVESWLERQKELNNISPLAVVTHAGVIRAALRFLQKTTYEQALTVNHDYGSVSETEFFC